MRSAYQKEKKSTKDETKQNAKNEKKKSDQFEM